VRLAASARSRWRLVAAAVSVACASCDAQALEVGTDHAAGEDATVGAPVDSASTASDDADHGGDGGGGPPGLSSGDAAALVYWADWQVADAGVVSGVVALPSGAVTVVYSGPLFGVQTDAGDVDFEPPTTFTSATVANPPPGPGILEFSGDETGTGTITFSAPIERPLLAIYNLGTGFAGQSASLGVDAPFTILSSGLNAAGANLFGNETLTVTDAGVSGVGANGVVELEGTFSVIHWNSPNDIPYASWTGVTVGARAQPEAPQR
jgi:hypothetical protein